jgi:hypothetical protein
LEHHPISVCEPAFIDEVNVRKCRPGLAHITH